MLADFGVGPDRGRGGKYLIMPQGYGPVEAPGYYVVPATSRDVLAGFRLLGDDKEAEIARIVPQIRTYSWTVEGTGEPMRRGPRATSNGARCRRGAWPTGRA